jgi:hypothetical protein
MFYIQMDSGIIYDIFDIVKDINETSIDPIDSTFIEEMISYIGKSECIVPHTYLVKYGVLNSDNNRILTDIKRLLKQYKFKENKQYIIRDISSLGVNGKISYRKNYFLHPRAFKKCLIRSKNSDKYLDYYLLLEEAIIQYRGSVNVKIRELESDIQMLNKQIVQYQNITLIDYIKSKFRSIIGLFYRQELDSINLIN